MKYTEEDVSLLFEEKEINKADVAKRLIKTNSDAEKFVRGENVKELEYIDRLVAIINEIKRIKMSTNQEIETCIARLEKEIASLNEGSAKKEKPKK